MSDPNIITARESSGGPPLGLGKYGTLRWAVKHPPEDPAISFRGKTVLVTGANTGLGFEAAVKYSALGADKLILGVRTREKGEATRRRILARTARPESTIVVVTVDLSTFDSVRSFIAALEGVTTRLDVALLNAGLGNPSYETAPSGREMALQVNVLSTALMAILLLPLLRRTADATGQRPHLTFVNSIGHSMVDRAWFSEKGSLLDAASDREKWDASRSYLIVKLIGMAVMKAIAGVTAACQGTHGPQVIVNAVCPGVCKTDLGRKFGLVSHLFMAPFQAIFARSAEQGSRSLVSATALDPESHGRLWTHDILYPYVPLSSPPDSRSDRLADLASSPGTRS